MSHSPAAIPERTLIGEARRLAQLAWPVVIAQLGMMAMGTVDTMMVGQLGRAELAGVSLGHMWSFGVLVLLLGCAAGLDPLFSQAFGGGRPLDAGRAFARGASFLALLALPIMALHLVAGPGLTWLGQPAEAVPIGAEYARVMTLGVLPFAAFVLLRRFLQGSGLMMPATWAILLGNIVNVAVNWVLVYGHYGAPKLGAVGAAWATVASRTVMLIPLLALGWPLLQRARPQLMDMLDFRGVARIASLCMPVGLQVTGEVWGFTLTTVVMGWLGSTAVASHTIALGLASIAFMVPFGIGQAASTRVGNLVGAGHPWGRAAWVSVAVGGCTMLLSGAVFLLVPGALARLYTPDVAVTALAVQLIPIAAAFGLFDGVQAVAFGVLRGAGDVRMPALANLVAYYLIGLPAGLLLAFPLGYGARGPWMGLALALGVVSVLLVLRMRWTLARGGFKV